MSGKEMTEQGGGGEVLKRTSQAEEGGCEQRHGVGLRKGVGKGGRESAGIALL